MAKRATRLASTTVLGLGGTAAAMPNGRAEPAIPAQGSEVAEAREAEAVAVGALAVARAKLAETAAAAPRVNARVTVAVAAVTKARTAAGRSAQLVQKARSAVLDAEADVEVAQAVAAETREQEASTNPSAGTSTRAAASAGLAAAATWGRRVRTADAARADLVDAEEHRVELEARVAAAEEERDTARSEEPVAPAALVAARVAVERAERELDAARGRVAAAVRRAAEGEWTAENVESAVPEFASLDAFVEDYVLPNWRHRPTSATWCATWWRHSEAISRLEACWEAFEVMRREPAPALSTWWRDHLDPHMRILTSPEGTFAGCKATRHDVVHMQQDVWPAHRAPNGVFDTDPDAPRQPKRVTNATHTASRTGSFTASLTSTVGTTGRSGLGDPETEPDPSATPTVIEA